jgi:hypothetical protein
MSTSETQKSRAFELFIEGRTVNAAAALLNIPWSRSKKFWNEWEKRHTEEKPDPEPGDGTSEAWEITLRVAPEDLDRILNAATEAEKSSAVQYLLQARLNAILEPGAEGDATD